MECSIGIVTREECHKTTYGAVNKQLTLVSELGEEKQTVLKLRLGECDLRSICKHHEIKYSVKYNHLFGNICCDPLKVHKRTIKKGLREISLEHLKKEKNFPVALVPGKSLCPNCYTKIFVLKETVSGGSSGSGRSEFAPMQENVAELEAVCSALDISPVAKIMKMNTGKRPAALSKKCRRISDSLRRKLASSFSDDSMGLDSDEQIPSFALSEEYDLLINKLKEKCLISNKEEKIKIISLLPTSWSRQKISQEFQVSEHLVRITRALQKTQGILPDLGKRRGHPVRDETIQAVTEFYENNENSRICPGKKDCVSVNVGGIKEHMQKRLILCNLMELYIHFKNTQPEHKIGFSKFCALRPKWCIIAGASGTHTVCVCSYHQNVKLMVEGATLNSDYKDLLRVMVCDIESYKCMSNECADCPGEEILTELLSAESESMPDQIVYKQWVNTDRANMISVMQTYSEFCESLIEKLTELKKHHYVAKIQSQYLKETRESLDETQCLVLADFAENYSFLVQDEIQSFHWVNQQATLHPFVYYYKADNITKCRSLCIISDHVKHDTATVYVF